MARRAAGTEGSLQPEAAPPRILVVEDEAIVAKDIETCIVRLGYQLAGRAKTASEAIHKALAERPDLVLMDIRLQGSEDGVFAACEIRRHASGTAVVYLTAYADDDTLQRAKLTEPFGYILKPFDERELRTTIEMALYKHRMERKLRESERWLAATLRSIGDGVLAADRGGAVVFLNAAAESLTGWRQDEATGRDVHQVFQIEADGEGTDAVSRALRDGGAAIRQETSLLARDQSSTPVEVTAAAIRDEEGHGAGIVVAFRDITDRRRMERQSSELLAREREANRMKDEFLAMLSHELRTPLSSILGWSQLLRSGEVDEGDAAHALEAIERNALRQLDLVEELLDVARIASGQLWLEPRPILLASIVRAALEGIEPGAKAKGLAVTFAEATPGEVFGDPGRLAQVVANLLSNALKFTPAGGRIDVELRTAGDLVELAVRDTGEGVGPEFIPHLFEEFRQEDGSNTRAHGGLGLGLALVRRLVELHAGSVVGESGGKGRGATFTVRLPASSGIPAVDPATSRARAVRLDGIRVLLVTEEADSRRVASAMLESHGATVVAAASAPEAMAALRRERPDALLIDLELRGEEAAILLRKVRAIAPEHAAGMPAAALVAGRRGEAERALAAGFQSHVAKPVDAGRLSSAVAALVARGTKN